MAITNGYVTQAEAKAWLNVPDTNDDSVVDDCVNAASRAIDRACGRYFYPQAAETRRFTAFDSSFVLIDDLVTLTTLKTDPGGDQTFEETWGSTDYYLEPQNAEESGIGFAYTRISTTPEGVYSFPRTSRGIEIVGTWGWSAAPPDVKMACLILTARYFARRDATLGIAGSDEMGSIRLSRVDPDVRTLLDPFVRRGPGVAFV